MSISSLFPRRFASSRNTRGDLLRKTVRLEIFCSSFTTSRSSRFIPSTFVNGCARSTPFGHLGTGDLGTGDSRGCTRSTPFGHLGTGDSRPISSFSLILLTCCATGSNPSEGCKQRLTDISRLTLPRRRQKTNGGRRESARPPKRSSPEKRTSQTNTPPPRLSRRGLSFYCLGW